MGPGRRGLAEGGAEGGAPGTPGTPGTGGHGWVRRLRPPSARGLRPSKPQLGLTPPEKQEPEGEGRPGGGAHAAEPEGATGIRVLREAAHVSSHVQGSAMWGQGQGLGTPRAHLPAQSTRTLA